MLQPIPDTRFSARGISERHRIWDLQCKPRLVLRNPLENVYPVMGPRWSRKSAVPIAQYMLALSVRVPHKKEARLPGRRPVEFRAET
jgi:hypothetical protein